MARWAGVQLLGVAPAGRQQDIEAACMLHERHCAATAAACAREYGTQCPAVFAGKALALT